MLVMSSLQRLSKYALNQKYRCHTGSLKDIQRLMQYTLKMIRLLLVGDAMLSLNNSSRRNCRYNLLKSRLSTSKMESCLGGSPPLPSSIIDLGTNHKSSIEFSKLLESRPIGRQREKNRWS